MQTYTLKNYKDAQNILFKSIWDLIINNCKVKTKNNQRGELCENMIDTSKDGNLMPIRMLYSNKKIYLNKSIDKK